MIFESSGYDFETCTGIPFGCWLAFKQNFGLHGLWYGLTVSLIYCSAWGLYLCLRTDWEQEVAKVQTRAQVMVQVTTEAESAKSKVAS